MIVKRILKLKSKTINNQNFIFLNHNWFCKNSDKNKINKDDGDYDAEKEMKYKKRLNIIENEILNNPQFDDAFPQFLQQNKKPRTYLKGEQTLDFLKSLGLEKRVKRQYKREEIYTENYKAFQEGFQSPNGANKYLDQEERKKIDIIIDQKLDELEKTGLSREEILFDSGKRGIPLEQDPFFQFIKNNCLARQLFIKSSEEYTVEKVVELALRQDIDPDPSQSRSSQKLSQTQLIDSNTNIEQTPNPNQFNPKQYLASESSKTKEYIDELLKPDQKYHYQPQTQEEQRRRLIRKINHFDIHWRNTELLTQFLTSASKIKHIRQTKLDRLTQRKISRTIKLARQMLILPYYGLVKPSDRKSLKTLEEDLEDFERKAINLETGHIYIKDRNDNQQVKQAETDYDLSVIPKSPKENSISLIQAIMYSYKKKEQRIISEGVDIQNAKKIKHSQISKNQKIIGHHIPKLLNQVNAPLIEEQILSYLTKQQLNQLKEEDQQISYEQTKEIINNKIEVNQFVDIFLSEKAQDFNQIDAYLSQVKLSENEKLSVSDSLEFINSLRRKKGLKDFQL